MGPERGWQPLTATQRSVDGFHVSPFTRLARVHAASVASDALIATSLAGSLFFSIPTGAARGKVALYLLLTMAPFAVIAPLIGPAIDRIHGGRRLMVIAAAGTRALVCAFMAFHVNDLLLFPSAFAVLVLGKAYGIAKSSLVPTVVADDAGLVEANSRLSLLSGVMGVAAVAPGALIMKLAGPEWVLALAVLTSASASLLATQLTGRPVAPEPAGAVEEAELRGEGILRAAEAMGLLRGMVGFLTFLLAFDLRGGGSDGPVPVGLALGHAVGNVSRHIVGQPLLVSKVSESPAWHFGVVAGASVFGGLLGAIVAPRLRRLVSEERILLSSLVAVAGVGAACALIGGLLGDSVLGLTLGVAASTGRLAFDSLVQRDAPDANFGRSFARYETRFQVVWVLGGFIPVIVPIPAQLGFVVVAGAAGFAAFAYAAGTGRRGPARRPLAAST
ncbi:MAG: MFS transporter [Acidimicrobiales bacterium]